MKIFQKVSKRFQSGLKPRSVRLATDRIAFECTQSRRLNLELYPPQLSRKSGWWREGNYGFQFQHLTGWFQLKSNSYKKITLSLDEEAKNYLTSDEHSPVRRESWAESYMSGCTPDLRLCRSKRPYNWDWTILRFRTIFLRHCTVAQDWLKNHRSDENISR